MKKHLLLAAALLVIGASAANAQYTDNIWMQTWDFNDGTQGWTGSAGIGPGGQMGTFFWDNATGGGSLAVGDNATWELPYLFKFGATHNPKFVLQADVLFLAANTFQGHSIALLRGDNRGPSLGGGNGGNYAAQGRDRSWDNTNRSANFVYGQGSPAVNTWFTVQIDYGWTTPGRMRFWIYSPINTDRQLAGTWWELTPGNIKNVNPDAITTFTKLALGHAYGANGYDTAGSQAWGQSRWDNVKIVPEPGSIVALGAGLIGMAGMIRRKK